MNKNKHKLSKKVLLSDYDNIIKIIKKMKNKHKEFLSNDECDQIIFLQKQLAYYKGRCIRYKEELKKLGITDPDSGVGVHINE